MAKVGLLSVSDGRASVHGDVGKFALGVEDRIANALEARGHQVVRANDVVWTNELAVREARRLADARPDLTILNIAVWAFPHFTMLAARELPGPLLLFSNVDPQYPGMVGMLAAAGALDQVGRVVRAGLGQRSTATACSTASRRTFMPAQRRSASAARRSAASAGGRWACIPPSRTPTSGCASSESTSRRSTSGSSCGARRRSTAARVTAAREWLERHAAGVHYDGERLTPELLERQIRSYYAMRELIEEWRLDFCGIKAQPELTNHFATMDVTEAFLNDPYDWDGPKPSIVCATEADMDAALTMRLLQSHQRHAVLFADVRHHHADLGVWDLCNSGQHATWLAARSDDPAENMRHVHLYPEEFYFPAGGASVHHLAAPGDVHVRTPDASRRPLSHACPSRCLRAVRRRDERAADAARRRTSGPTHSHASRPTRTRSSPVTARTTSTPFPGNMSRRCGRSADCSTSTTTASAPRRERTRPRYRHRHRVLQGRRLLARGHDRGAGGARARRVDAAARLVRARRRGDLVERRAGDLLRAPARTGREVGGSVHHRHRPVRRPMRRRPARRCGRQSSTASTRRAEAEVGRAHRTVRRRRHHARAAGRRFPARRSARSSCGCGGTSRTFGVAPAAGTWPAASSSNG